MFGKRKAAVEEPEPPTREYVSLEQEALLNVKSADATLATATGRLQTFVRRNFRVVDGSLAYCSDRWNRDQLDQRLRELLVEQDVARDWFHAALQKWSQLKKK